MSEANLSRRTVLPDQHKDGVILLHGIGRTFRNMQRIEAALRGAGFATFNITYPSTRLNILENADFLQAESADFQSSIKDKIHIVAFSMGGLVARALIKKYRPENLGRVVMIGTPNKGSEVADIFHKMRPFQFFYGPAGQQLISRRNAFQDLLGPIDFDLGVIAGCSRIHPFSSLIFAEESDGIVSVASTKIEGMSDHIVIPHSHTALPVTKKTAELSVRFLKNGNFKYASDESDQA